ncbi:MAG: hypothetical protein B6D44_01225 [Ignavibacteriales bacterium UTCHB2]|jgi:2-polyprenyl-3-methyl-5-hydroxy-6-metoxy-1,4-benzoquinol methylase|nr:MAG: hypothetical protein B6D44_01225 [Ignavibacteriales bacterium UTCHB2]
MQEDYKKKIYNNYHSYHTKQLYGSITIDSIRKQSAAWKYYFSEFLPDNKDAIILDAGCGYGGFVFWLQELGYKDSTGVDLSQELISIGKSVGIKNILRRDIFEQLKENENKYDLIICRDVLEHLTKDQVFEIFGLFFNSLKLSGKLILQVPNGFSPNYSKIFYGDVTHETLFSEAILNQISLATGFKNLSIKEVTPVPKGIISLGRYFMWTIIKNYYRLIQLIETGSSRGFYSQNIIASMRK